jgi:hypothetical protein
MSVHSTWVQAPASTLENPDVRDMPQPSIRRDSLFGWPACHIWRNIYLWVPKMTVWPS